MTTLATRDRVSEICNSPGDTSPFQFIGVTDASYMAFADADIDGASVAYCARNRSTGQWETGVGTYTQSTNQLSRDGSFRSSEGTATKTDFGVGIVDVWIDATAVKTPQYDADSDNLTLLGGLLANGSGQFTAGADADTDLAIGEGGAAPSTNRTASLTLNAPDSGSHRGIVRALFKRASSLIWGVGLLAAAAGTMGAATDYAWDPGTGTPVASLSTAGRLRLADGLDVGGTIQLNGIGPRRLVRCAPRSTTR